MDLPLVKSLQRESKPNTSLQVNHRQLLTPLPLIRESAPVAERPPSSLNAFAPLTSSQPENILDFDLETVAAGYGDPEWVRSKITCCGWSWIGSGVIESRIATPAGIFGNSSLRRDMLAALLEQIRKADLLVGQYIEKFDLPIINTECMYLGLDIIREAWVQDTKRLPRTRGLKRDQANLCEMYGTDERKMELNANQWDAAYNEAEWKTIRDRCESDVRANIQLREKQLRAGHLRPPRKWVGFK